MPSPLHALRIIRIQTGEAAFLVAEDIAEALFNRVPTRESREKGRPDDTGREGGGGVGVIDGLMLVPVAEVQQDYGL